jgi:hypothetical protein
MKFVNILTELWCKPTLMLPTMHKVLCDIIEAHMTDMHIDDVAFDLGVKPEKEPCMFVLDNNMAIIPIQGVIGKHVSAITKSSGVTDVNSISNMVHEAVSDPTIEGILYDVNSLMLSMHRKARAWAASASTWRT